VDGLRAAGFEYRSRLRLFGVPLVHVVRGIDPATGRRPPAVGIIAVGQVAIGVVSVGQLAVGLVAVGQLALGGLAGLGQIALAVVAVGQICGGAVASVGQAALGPRSLGIVEGDGVAWALVWSATCLTLGLAWMRERRSFAPFLSLVRRPPTALADLRDGMHCVRARITSADDQQAPLSGRACVHWEALRSGPGTRERDRRGDRLLLSDGTGTAEVMLDRATLIIRNGSYSDLAGPDWTMQMESFLTRGEEVLVAGPVTLAPTGASDGPYRGGALTPVFQASGDGPLLVSTEPTSSLRAAARFSYAVLATVTAIAATTAALLL
jgi:hypothetical protein